MRSRNRISALVALALAASVPPLVLTNPAQAAVPPAEVTVVHGIPGTPVNIYVDGKLTVSDFSFGNVAGPLSLSPGTYAIAVRPYKAPATSAPVLSASVAVTSGENASVVAHLTAGGAPALSVFNNPTSAPPTGDARVVVRHVAEAPGVDIYAGSTRVVTDLTNPEQGSLFVPAGDAVVTADLTGTKTTVIGPAAFDFGAGTTTIIYAIGSASAKTLTVATQTYSSPAPVQPAPAQPPAEVTVVHGIPGTSVDIYVDGQLTLSNFTFDQVAGPLALEPGTYTVALLPHGAPATSAPLLETILDRKSVV